MKPRRPGKKNAHVRRKMVRNLEEKFEGQRIRGMRTALATRQTLLQSLQVFIRRIPALSPNDLEGLWKKAMIDPKWKGDKDALRRMSMENFRAVLLIRIGNEIDQLTRITGEMDEDIQEIERESR